MIRNPIIGLLCLLGLLVTSCSSFHCDDPLGCLVIPPDEPVVIGVLRATLGPKAALGEAMLDGIEQALEEHPTILGHEVRLARAGSECQASSARLAVTSLITDASVFLVIGPTCKEETEAIAPLLSDAGMVLITPPPGPQAAYTLTRKILEAIEQLAIRDGNGSLYLPRQALQEILSPLE